jgi:Ca2+-transporting ATPase
MLVDRNISKKPFWMLPVTEVLQLLHTSEQGLTTKEAERRIELYGPNLIEERKRPGKLSVFARQFRNPLIFLLLISGGITIALRDYHDAIFILIAAFFNAGLGFYQESKAQDALAHLDTYLAKRVRVIREGVEVEIDSERLVPGDIIRVAMGNRVPADARLLQSNDIEVDQSILTGESMPVTKNAEPASERAALGDQRCIIFAGTNVVQGVGIAVVTATDAQTQIGTIAKLVNKPGATQTPFHRALADFSLRATGFVIILSAALFFLAKTEGISTLESFLIAVAILVAAIPEGLPIVITVILAIGVQRLAKRKGVIRQLSAAETLGSTTVILTDKTGTLTEAKMTLERVQSFEQDERLPSAVSQEEFILHTALLNVDVVVQNPHEHHNGWKMLGKPLEIALVKAAALREIHFPTFKEGKEAIHLLPFNSLNKFSASVYKMPETWFKGSFRNTTPHVLSLFGAPEKLLEFSDIATHEKERILAEIKNLAAAGERVVAVATKELDTLEGFHFRDNTHLKGLRFLGVLSFKDPLRPEARHAIHEVQSAGIRVVIVTGDHAGTATSIATELGMKVGPRGVLDGVELDEMSTEALAERLSELVIVARVSPQGKVKIVKAFQESGEIVAMNGDGINDAPALRQADIGIAMGTGTDVSKDVADMVLLDDNFETIVAAIAEGRRILSNIRKAIIYMTSTVLDTVFLIGGSIIIGIAIPVNPLQILWINFFTGSFPGIALAFDKGDSRTQMHQGVSKSIFTNEMKFLIFVNGTISSILLFTTYDLLLRLGFETNLVQSFVFAALGTYSLFVVLAIRNLKKTIFGYNPFSNTYLTMSIVLGVGCTLLVIYVPFLQRFFGTTALPPLWLLGVFGFGFFNILLIELTKVFFNRESD